MYIEVLTKDDLSSIVASQFPSVPSDLVEKMIYFNEGVQCDIDLRLYGQQGSPWEFNLRDIFRWCQLLQSHGANMDSERAAKFADMLYTQRLRTNHDRSLITKRLHAHFGDASENSYPRLEITHDHVLIGNTSLKRYLSSSHWLDVPTMPKAESFSQSLLRPMEAVACCIHMDWPCLLVGPSSSGKSVILKTLADSCNVHLETLAMTSSTDVTELIGCFEQTDAMKSLKGMINSVRQVYEGVCLDDRVESELLQTINTHYWHVSEKTLKLEQSETSFTGDKALAFDLDKLVKCYEQLAGLNLLSESASGQVASVRQRLSLLKHKSSASKVQSPFQWVDGVLVQAMERGCWLHLENVNFCPSSVLDRLNPLMEFGGELVMTECGISDDGKHATPRVIQPHPNFRLILSMNSTSHGEVSRAMRNRCIEVCVLPPVLDKDSDTSQTKAGCEVETIDALTGLFDSGVRSHDAGQRMLMLHQEDCQRSVAFQEEPHSIRILKDWGSLFVGLLKRGMAQASLSASCKILYEVELAYTCICNTSTMELVASTPLQRGLGSCPSAARTIQGSRLLRALTAATNNDQAFQHFKHLISMTPLSYTSYTVSFQRQELAKLWCQSICRLVETTPISDTRFLASYYDGFCAKTATQIKTSLVLNAKLSQMSAFCAARNSQLLEETVTYDQLRHVTVLPVPSDMSVVAVSYYMGIKRIDASVVTCPVTPLLFPLFHWFDAYLSLWHGDNMHCHQILSTYEHLLLCRDRLWNSLKRTQYTGNGSKSQIGFEFAGFLMQYYWVKKAFTKFNSCMHEDSENGNVDPAPLTRKMLLSFESIDDAIQESTGGSVSSTDILWKKGGHPLLPSKLDDFIQLDHLQNISKSCALTKDDLFGFAIIISSPFAAHIDLKQLMATNHPSLFVDPQFDKDLLSAMAMSFWASTDEAQGVTAKGGFALNAQKAFSKRFNELSQDFVANVHLATIDTSIMTVDNALDMDVIKSIVGEDTDQRQNRDEFLSNLLTRFGDIQAAQIGEIYCVYEEGAIFGKLSGIARQCQSSGCDEMTKSLRNLCPEIKSFISTSLAHTQWPVGDLRPYQTLLWALDSEKTTNDFLLHIMRSTMPRMLLSFNSHQWCNMYNNLDLVSSNLAGPSLWNKEGSGAPARVNVSLLGLSTKRCFVESNAGPTRTELNVDRAAFFRLLRLPSSHTGAAYLTMENGHARKFQAKKLSSLLASQRVLQSYKQHTEMIRFHLWAVFDAFQDDFGEIRSDISTLLESQPINASAIASAFKLCKNKVIQIHINTLMVPLIESIQGTNESEEGSFPWKRHLARARVYLGLLRLNLLVPSSPIDPGRKPAAKAEELGWFLKEIGSNLLSHSLHFGLSYGDFAPDSSQTRCLRALGKWLGLSLFEIMLFASCRTLACGLLMEVETLLPFGQFCITFFQFSAFVSLSCFPL